MLLLIVAAAMGFQAGDRMQQVEFVRLSYKANKDSFAFGTFRFEYTRGLCASRADAESEIFSKSIKEDGLYVFEGKNARYDLIANPAELAAVTTRIGDRQTSSFAKTFRMATDGEATLLDLLSLDEANKFSVRVPEIYPGSDTFYADGFFEFPLWLGFSGVRPDDVFSDLTAIKEGRAALADIDFEAQLNGLKVCKVSFTFAEGKRTHWIDAGRGYAPLRTESQYGETGVEITYTFSELERVPGAGWLPRRRLHIIGNGQVADVIKITAIDTKNKPDLSAFQLEFPKPVKVRDRSRNLDYPPSKTLSLLKRPDRLAAGVHAVVSRTINLPAEMPGERESGLPWMIIIPAGLAVVAVVASVGYLAIRKRKL